MNAFQIDLDAPKANAAYDHAKAMAKSVGLTINEATSYNTNTMDAHRMVQWAKATYHDFKLIENLADDLFYVYFTENKELADHKVLLDVAKKNKIDTAEVKKILDSKCISRCSYARRG